MPRPLIQRTEKLVYSTRWFDPDADKSDAPAHLLTIEIVIHDEQRDERLNALSKRRNLFGFLKSEARSHVYA